MSPRTHWVRVDHEVVGGRKTGGPRHPPGSARLRGSTTGRCFTPRRRQRAFPGLLSRLMSAVTRSVCRGALRGTAVDAAHGSFPGSCGRWRRRRAPRRRCRAGPATPLQRQPGDFSSEPMPRDEPSDHEDKDDRGKRHPQHPVSREVADQQQGAANYDRRRASNIQRPRKPPTRLTPAIRMPSSPRGRPATINGPIRSSAARANKHIPSLCRRWVRGTPTATTRTAVWYEERSCSRAKVTRR